MVTRRKTRPVAGIGALLALVVAGTAFVLMSRAPEQARVTSADGRVSVAGSAAPSSGALAAEPATSAAPKAPPRAIAPATRLTLGGLPIPAGFEITWHYLDADLGGAAPARLSLAAYDPESSAWVPVPSVVDPSARVVTVTVPPTRAVWWVLVAPLRSATY